MITRLAGNVFWMARYLERAENNARLIRMALGHETLPKAGPVGLWSTALEVGGTLDDYQERIGAVERDRVLAFMVLDRSNASSIVSCLRCVRDNARTARHLLAESAWETVNTTWQQALELERVEDPWAVTAWAVERCRLAWGCFDDLWRDAVPHALHLGEAVERADFTARILAEMLPALLVDGADPPDIDSDSARRWKSLLAGLGLTETWRRAKRGPLDPAMLLELILRHPVSPHALLANVRRMADAIVGFAGPGRGGNALGTAHELAAFIEFADLRRPQADSMAAFVAELTARTNRLGAEAGREHFSWEG